MRTLKNMKALLCFLTSIQVALTFKPSVPPLKDAQVLVIGASGRLGGEVRRLMSYRVVSLKRFFGQINAHSPILEESKNVDCGASPLHVEFWEECCPVAYMITRP